MTIVMYKKTSEDGTIAEIEQYKNLKSYCLFITDKYGRTLKKDFYNTIENAKQAGNRYFKTYVYYNCTQWKKVICEAWTTRKTEE